MRSAASTRFAMTRLSIAEELESAADRIADISRADLQIILRRAALMLRNVAGVPLEPAVEETLSSLAAEMNIGRTDLIRIVLREWLESNAYLPVRMVDEDSDTDGNAQRLPRSHHTSADNLVLPQGCGGL